MPFPFSCSKSSRIRFLRGEKASPPAPSRGRSGAAPCLWRRRARLCGSVTVEAALVLPLYLMAVITVASFLKTEALSSKRVLELSNTARKIASYSGIVQTEGNGIFIDLFDRVALGLPFAEVFGVESPGISVRARVYPWVGYEAEGGGEDDGETIVYVTDNRSVYHLSSKCTHISLGIFKASQSEIMNLRNTDGKRYKKCEGFPEGYAGAVYAGVSGDYYYPSLEAAPLTRHVRAVKLSECGDIPPCSRCGGAAAEVQEAA